MGTREIVLSTGNGSAVARLRREAVSLPGVTDCVYIRDMTGAERDQFLSSKKDDSRPHLTAARLLTMCLVDEQNQRIFEDADAEDLCNAVSGRLIEQLSETALRINGLGEAAMEQVEKNSPEILNGGSG